VAGPFHHRFRVRYHECDPQGIVFNANYLTFHDMSVTELWREAFGSWTGFVAESGLDMVVAEARITYLAPLRFDDEVDARVAVRHLGTTSVVIGTRFECGGARAAEVEARYVVVDPETHAKKPIPDDVRETLDRYSR
jgi:acyl-CoA thioester hydrolase